MYLFVVKKSLKDAHVTSTGVEMHIFTLENVHRT
jgi:hypothetical protein